MGYSLKTDPCNCTAGQGNPTRLFFNAHNSRTGELGLTVEFQITETVFLGSHRQREMNSKPVTSLLNPGLTHLHSTAIYTSPTHMDIKTLKHVGAGSHHYATKLSMQSAKILKHTN